MKICVSFEDRIRKDSTGVYFLPAFKSLGHEVTHVLPTDIHNVDGGFDLYLKVDDGIADYRWNPKLHPSAYYVIDTHIEAEWRVALAKEGEFDVVTTAQLGGVSLPWHVKASWVPLAADKDLHNVGAREKEYDICWIGNFHTAHAFRRVKAVDAAFKGAKTIFFGSRTFKDMAEVYAKSKIVFNEALNGDINMRFFEGMASGSCLLTDYLAEMDKLGFIPGGHYSSWKEIDHIKQSVETLLANDAMRERIAAAGQREVFARHLYSHRAQEIIKKVEESKLCLR